MADLYLDWHSDFQVSSTGDLLVIDQDTEVRQRLERRLFTAEKGYVWHPEYGAGLPQKIGSVYSLYEIQSLVTSQIQMEDSVAKNPAPILTFLKSPNDPSNIMIGIQYWDAKTGVSVSFTITI